MSGREYDRRGMDTNRIVTATVGGYLRSGAEHEPPGFLRA
jgi:hypothetical protein